ncbi:MAG: hypothetical protein IJT91_01855 [Clostridia bacterium]|nr:hypothetical protein [Clostridia bacterium]
MKIRSIRTYAARSAAILLAAMIAFGAAAIVCAANGSAYVHDPLLNPSAAKDIVADENAVYGFRPSETGSLTMYSEYDWTDPGVVEQGRQERIKYHEELESMYWMLLEMRSEDKSAEEIARAVSTRRNEIRLEAYKDDPEGLADVKARNLELYGHEEGPLPDELFEKYGSWETVISKAFSPNSGMDACVGLYDDYYYLYVALGQVEDDGLGKVVCGAEDVTGRLSDAELESIKPILTDGKELIKAFRVSVTMNGLDYLSEEAQGMTLPLSAEESDGFSDIGFYKINSDGVASAVGFEKQDGVIAVSVHSGGVYFLAGVKKTEETAPETSDTASVETTTEAPETTKPAETSKPADTTKPAASTTAASKTASPKTGEEDAPVKYMIAVFVSFAVFAGAAVYFTKKRGAN